jgi:hypothetical protein
MVYQPFKGSSFLGKQSGWNTRARDTQVDVPHHAAERAALHKERQGREAVDERLTGVMVPGIGIERLSGPDVDEQRPTATGGCRDGRGEILPWRPRGTDTRCRES